jgi:uncharacterized protein (TIGR02246 family)
MNRTTATLALPLTLVVLSGTWTAPVRAQTATKPAARGAAADPRAADRAAIRDVLQSFAKAFGSGDAKALAGHWTAEGEFEGEEAGAVRGRDALEKEYAALFAEHPKASAEAQPESLRFVSRDGAIAEGSVTVRRGPSEPAVTAHFTALLVREDGRWLLASLRESAVQESSLHDLAWLVGDWKSTGEGGAEVLTSYAWDDDSRKFLRVRFSIKDGDRTHRGTQMIGVDPATGELRGWTFESGGGVGEATWTRDGAHWVIESAGTLADGGTLVATNILTKVDEDTFTWQSIDRVLEGGDLPDLAPVKVTRVKAKE